MARQNQYGAKTTDLDEVEFHTPLADHPAFIAFKERMLAMLQSLDHEPSQRQLRQLLGVGDNDIERRWWNTAVSLNYEDMEYFQRGQITHYRARTLRRTPDPHVNPPMHIRRGRGIKLAPSTPQITPDISSYEKYKVTA